MINVRKGTDWLEEGRKKKKEKKCFLPTAAPSRRNDEETKKVITCNSNTTAVATTLFPAAHSTSSSSPITSRSRIISKPWERMGSLSLSSSSQLPHHSIISSTSPGKRRVGGRNEHGFSTTASTAPYLFTRMKSIATTAPILILLLIIFIVTVPDVVQGNQTIISTYPPSLIASSQLSSSTEKSNPTDEPELHHVGQYIQSHSTNFGNHHHHPYPPSSVSRSYQTEMPLSDEPISTTGQHHSCYVCLPPDKTSREADEILSIFPEETRNHIPDCASFGSQNTNRFEFKCPPEYVGCLLRIHGKNESRSCGKLPLNDCKTANSVELCYCTGALCNGMRPEISIEDTESDERQRTQLEDEKEERETRKWQKGETDDEDLLGPHHLDIDGMQDDTGDYGSGSEPPGVIAPYTSTPKPTLIPNIRPDPRTTTPASVSSAPGTTTGMPFYSAFRIPFTSIIIPASAYLVSLVPLLLPVIQLQLWDLSSSLQPLVKNQ